jgi:hypothetical protein
MCWLAGAAKTERQGHSRAFLAAAAAAAAPTEGSSELTSSLAEQLLQGGSGVRGLLLHGIGGIGKTTLAAHIALALQPAAAAAGGAGAGAGGVGRFPGGVFCASLQVGGVEDEAVREKVRCYCVHAFQGTCLAEDGCCV